MIRSLLFVLLLAVCVTPGAEAQSDELTVDLSFSPPSFTADGGGHYTVQVDGLPNTVEAGMPMVPVKTVTLALPAGFAADSVRLEEGAHTVYRSAIARSLGTAPLSWRTSRPAHLRVIAAPVIGGASYPEQRTRLSVQKYHGASVAVIAIYPILVSRDGKRADFVAHARLHLPLRAIRGPVPALLPHQRDEVRSAVDNPEAVASYAARTLHRDEQYEYLILSTSDYIGFTGENGLKALQQGLQARNLRSKIVDLQTVAAGSDGRDLPEKIRFYIRNEYKQHGIQYVLLAGRAQDGSDSTIPARPLWSKIRAYMGGQWTDDEENIPSDFYYACLDGSFNGNGNDKWGEPGDGDGGGDVDFMCEVTVGRVALDSTQDLQNFVRKTLWAYAHPFPKKVLLLGEELFPELSIYGDDYMKQLVDSCADHGFNTKGYTSDWGADTLYDRDHQWSGDEALSKINAGGFGMVNHLGHSNEDYNMRMSSAGGLPEFTNATPFFYYSQGCLAGNFTRGSFIDKLVRHANAAVAAVGNASYGLSPEDPSPSTTKTPGASQMFHRQFINQIFGVGTHIMGKAHADSKKAFNGMNNAQEIRWVDWSATYFGDPSLPLNY